MKYILIFFLTIVCIDLSFSQCTQLTKVVKVAEKHFDEGDLESAFDTLFVTLNNDKISYCAPERFKAQLLLTEVSLFLNQDSLAEIAFNSALDIAPRYKVDTTLEPIDLYYFSLGYRTVPRFSIRPYIGLNNYEFNNTFRYFPVSSTEQLYNVNVNQDATHRAELGYSVGAQVGWHLTNFFEASIGAAYNSKNIEIKKSIGVKNLTLSEHQDWLTIPALAKIKLGNQGFIPKLILGIEYNWLINATLTDLENGNLKSDNNKININNLRNRHHYAYVAGIGTDFRFSKRSRNYFSLEIKYSNQQTALINSAERYNNAETLFGLGYVDNDIPIGIHHLEVSVGLVITKYRVQKIKK